MRIPIFLSYPKPHLQLQKEFVNEVNKYLVDRGFEPRTLGVTDYDMEEPLTAIRSLLLESNGLITIAFKRTYIEAGICKKDSDLNEESSDISKKWLTSPYCHIEPAMAYQIGLPILILREKDVIDDGILERGVTGTYLPEFDLEKGSIDYLNREEWKQVIGKWEGFVRTVVRNKGCPPKLY